MLPGVAGLVAVDAATGVIDVAAQAAGNPSALLSAGVVVLGAAAAGDVVALQAGLAVPAESPSALHFAGVADPGAQSTLAAAAGDVAALQAGLAVPGAVGSGAPASTAPGDIVSPGADGPFAPVAAFDMGLVAERLAALHPAVLQVSRIVAGDLAGLQALQAAGLALPSSALGANAPAATAVGGSMSSDTNGPVAPGAPGDIGAAVGNPWACSVPRAPARSRAPSRTLSHGPPAEPLSAHDKHPIPSLRSEGPGQLGQQARDRSRSPGPVGRRNASSSSSSSWWSSSDEDEFGTDIFLGWSAADWIDTSWRVTDVEVGPQRTFVFVFPVSLFVLCVFFVVFVFHCVILFFLFS